MMLPTEAAMTTRRSSLGGILEAAIGLPSCKAHCVHMPGYRCISVRRTAGPSCATTCRISVFKGWILVEHAAEEAGEAELVTWLRPPESRHPVLHHGTPQEDPVLDAAQPGSGGLAAARRGVHLRRLDAHLQWGIPGLRPMGRALLRARAR